MWHRSHLTHVTRQEQQISIPPILVLKMLHTPSPEEKKKSKPNKFLPYWFPLSQLKLNGLHSIAQRRANRRALTTSPSSRSRRALGPSSRRGSKLHSSGEASEFDRIGYEFASRGKIFRQSRCECHQGVGLATEAQTGGPTCEATN